MIEKSKSKKAEGRSSTSSIKPVTTQKIDVFKNCSNMEVMVKALSILMIDASSTLNCEMP